MLLYTLLWMQWCILFRICVSFQCIYYLIATHTVHTRTHKWNAHGYRMEQNVYMVSFATSKRIKLCKLLQKRFWSHCIHGQIAYVPFYAVLYDNWSLTIKLCRLELQYYNITIFWSPEFRIIRIRNVIPQTMKTKTPGVESRK